MRILDMRVEVTTGTSHVVYAGHVNISPQRAKCLDGGLDLGRMRLMSAVFEHK